MVMSQPAGGQSGNEHCQTDEHHDPPPSEMPLRMLLLRIAVVIMPIFHFMHDISFVAYALGSAFLMTFLVAMPCMQPVMDPVCNHSDKYRQHKQYCKNYQRLLRNHCQHHECLIARRSYHHSYKGPETEHPVGIQGNRRESSHAPRNRSQKRSHYHLAEFRPAQPLEHHSSGFDVEGLDHHHHDHHQTGDEHGIP